MGVSYEVFKAVSGWFALSTGYLAVSRNFFFYKFIYFFSERQRERAEGQTERGRERGSHAPC